jgi:hypothetical protein
VSALFVDHYVLGWIVGLGYSVLGGHWLLAWASRKMWFAIDLDPEGQLERPSPWQPKAQGLVERALFTPAIVTGNGGFIAVWLALKVTAQWKSWGVNQTGSTTGRVVKGREVFVNFILGTGLSIAIAATGAFAIELFDAGRARDAFLLIGATTVACGAFGVWVEYEGRKFLDRVRAKAAAESAT